MSSIIFSNRFSKFLNSCHRCEPCRGCEPCCRCKLSKNLCINSWNFSNAPRLKRSSSNSFSSLRISFSFSSNFFSFY